VGNPDPLLGELLTGGQASPRVRSSPQPALPRLSSLVSSPMLFALLMSSFCARLWSVWVPGCGVGCSPVSTDAVFCLDTALPRWKRMALAADLKLAARIRSGGDSRAPYIHG
jgi:hypothetical protein